MTSRPLITDDQRRIRLARRHAIAPAHRVADVEAATRAMTVLHATEAPTVYLSAMARADGITVADIDRALYEDRGLVKQLAMRRTLFVFPRDLLPAALGSASARVAESEARRIAKAVAAAGLTHDGLAWLESACDAVLSAVSEAGSLAAREIRESVAMVAGKIDVSPNSKWGAAVNVSPWVTNVLGLRGHLVRGQAIGHWRNPRPVWTRMDDWLAGAAAGLRGVSSEEGYAEIVARWLATFGPGTTEDLVWWLGSTKAAARKALSDVHAVEVELEDGRLGWVLPGDEEPEPPVEPWAALLPVLDPTTMGWKSRGFYLDPEHVPFLFDSNGNGGTTAWWNGRVVGCWVQDPDGTVRVVLREDVGREAEQALAVQAERLTTWLDGVVITSVYASYQMRAERLP